MTTEDSSSSPDTGESSSSESGVADSREAEQQQPPPPPQEQQKKQPQERGEQGGARYSSEASSNSATAVSKMQLDSKWLAVTAPCSPPNRGQGSYAADIYMGDGGHSGQGFQGGAEAATAGGGRDACRPVGWARLPDAGQCGT